MLWLRNPRRYRAIAGFAPICAPTEVPWGEKAFSACLGDDPDTWRAYDASVLLADAGCDAPPIRVEQGEADGFLTVQLRPERLEAEAKQAGAAVTVNRRAGYDHSYFFDRQLHG